MLLSYDSMAVELMPHVVRTSIQQKRSISFTRWLIFDLFVHETEPFSSRWSIITYSSYRSVVVGTKCTHKVSVCMSLQFSEPEAYR